MSTVTPTLNITYPNKQRGVVLVIGLVLLVLLTLMGLTAMRTSTLEERMASHSQDRSLAFQSAEAGVRAAQTVIDTVAVGVPIGTFGNALNSDGTYNPRNSSNASATVNGEACTTTICRPWWEVIDWSDANSVAATAGLANVAQQPRYIIEDYTTYVLLQGEDVGQPPAANTPRTYRITVRAVGAQMGSNGTPVSIVMLQRYYQH